MKVRGHRFKAPLVFFSVCVLLPTYHFAAEFAEVGRMTEPEEVKPRRQRTRHEVQQLVRSLEQAAYHEASSAGSTQ
jgi:hypothetical protein